MSIIDLYDLSIYNPQTTIDSRNCSKGSISFALRNGKLDGSQYAGKTSASGCAYAVIDDLDYYIGERMTLAGNTLKTLQQLVHHHRKILGLSIIGITGTNGKTMTKELLATVLSMRFNLLYTEGDSDNHIDVSLILPRLTHDHEMAVTEMGVGHPGDIKELADIVHPSYDIITNVDRAHLEGLGSFEGTIRTKGESYDYIHRSKDKIFIEKEDEYLQPIVKGIEQITYGNGDDVFVSGQVVSCGPLLVFNWK